MLLLPLFLAVCFAPMALDSVEADFEVREKIVYTTVVDRELLLDAWVPNKDGNHAAVLVVHGGAWRSGDRKQLRSYADSLAKRGFVCFAIDYRLAPNDKFPAQIEDCREAVKWIRAHAAEYKVNPDKLGAIGYSAGGHLVCLLATTGEAPSEENGHVDTRIQCVAAGGAPTDFRTSPDNGNWARYWMGGDLTTAPDKFHDASATAFVDKDDPPIFFFNGTADELVPIAWSMSCYNALKAHGVKTEMHRIDGAGHLLAAINSAALDRAYTFLQQELQNESDMESHAGTVLHEKLMAPLAQSAPR